MTDTINDQQESADAVFGGGETDILSVVTEARGPVGRLPIGEADLLERPSGDIFGWTQDVGIGLEPFGTQPPGGLTSALRAASARADGQPAGPRVSYGAWK